ncbi:aspartate dehydrogenase [Alkalihalobacillus sp. BA299]|uniref:aspartate dehydrogenase n=1 Tax=Alkalihalobacillus sp. BA299 TaxID=2815938 RepID=UPI001ADBB679|nr:aspartate dehydrogenase [Alkalihalobacillus sp. BA299]
MKIGLIGSGNIGEFLLEKINHDPNNKYEITSIYSRNSERSNALAEKYEAIAYHDFATFLTADLDLVIEAANLEVAKQYAPLILRNGKNLLVISVGAFADTEFDAKIKRICKEFKTTVYLPSGAIGGLDIIKSAIAADTVDYVSITTRKPAHSLITQEITEAKVIYEGSAKEAIAQFPKNVNVSIVLSLAGIGVEATKVKIIADPTIDKNIHTIEAKGAFGTFSINIENNPMPSNPKTSFLAALSILSTLKNIGEDVRVG